MSTIVVVRKDGAAAIGADTLTTYGRTREPAEYVRNHSKIVTVGRSLIATVGHASWALVLTSYFSRFEQAPPLDSPQSIFDTFREAHRILKEDYFLNPNEDQDDDPEFESSQLDCLIANPSGIFGLDTRRSVQEYTRFTAVGSGYKYALGAMYAVYPTAASAEEIARVGLQASCELDTYTRLPIEIHTVPLTGGS